MSVEYTRDPASLSYDDYKGWIRLEVLKFLVDHEGDSDFPSHIVPDIGAFETMIDAYDAAFDPYFTLIDQANAKNKLFTTAAEALADKLQQIKYALPTIAPDPDILADFNLASGVPEDRDLLLTVAGNALTHWADVSADPMFGPVVGDFTALQTLYSDCIDARLVYVDREDQRQAAQNSVLATREALHVTERKVFNWYRSRHPNGQDEWWTNSPWGKTSGGSSGGGEEPGSWEDAVANLVVVEGVGSAASIRGDVSPDADGVAIFLAEGPMGDDTVPVRPVDPIEPLVPSLPYDMPVSFNVRVWIWVCHVKDGAYGEMAGPVWIEIVK